MAQQEFKWEEESATEFAQFWFTNSQMCKGEAIAAFKKSKEPKPLFIANDGAEIFPGQHYWDVDKTFGVCKRMAVKGCVVTAAFSTVEAAHEYAQNNKVKPISQASFEEAAEPLIKWINQHKNPHTRVIVTNTDAVILQELQSYHTTEFIKY